MWFTGRRDRLRTNIPYLGQIVNGNVRIAFTELSFYSYGGYVRYHKCSSTYIGYQTSRNRSRGTHHPLNTSANALSTASKKV